MTKADREWWDNWAETHKLVKVVFWWKEKGSESECTFHNTTFNQALEKAKQFGYKEPKWYKPWSWSNGVVTVG